MKWNATIFSLNGTTNLESEGAPFILISYNDLWGWEEAEEIECDYFFIKWYDEFGVRWSSFHINMVRRFLGLIELKMYYKVRRYLSTNWGLWKIYNTLLKCLTEKTVNWKKCLSEKKFQFSIEKLDLLMT